MDYSGLQKEISDAIREFGFQVTIEKDDGSTFKSIAVFDVTRKDNSSQSTTTSDATLIVAVSKQVPEVGDYLKTKDGTVYQAMKVEAIAPGLVPLAYTVTVA